MAPRKSRPPGAQILIDPDWRANPDLIPKSRVFSAPDSDLQLLGHPATVPRDRLLRSYTAPTL